MDVDQQEAKRRVGEQAARRVGYGQQLGLGTGSTVACFLDALAARIHGGELEGVRGVPTSRDTAERCAKLGIELIELDEVGALDLCVDGADEVAPGLQLTKGMGGALFREKVVASISRSYLAIVDATKEVHRLGEKSPIPVEVPPYAVPVVVRELVDLDARLRGGAVAPFTTDNGNHILDLHTGPIDDPHELDARLNATVGVLEHGLFLDTATACLVATDDGILQRTE